MYPKWKMDPPGEVNFSKIFTFWATLYVALKWGRVSGKAVPYLVIFVCRKISRISLYSRKFPASEYFLLYSALKMVPLRYEQAGSTYTDNCSHWSRNRATTDKVRYNRLSKIWLRAGNSSRQIIINFTQNVHQEQGNSRTQNLNQRQVKPLMERNNWECMALYWENVQGL